MRRSITCAVLAGSLSFIAIALFSRARADEAAKETPVPIQEEKSCVAALKERGVTFNPQAVLVFNSPTMAEGETQVLHRLTGLRSSKAKVRILMVCGVLRPTRRGTPWLDLTYELVQDDADQTPALKIHSPQPVPRNQHMQIAVLFETESLNGGVDEGGRHVFELPEYPENLSFMLPEGLAVVSCSRPLVIREEDGRTVVMNENLTNMHSLGVDRIMVLTRRFDHGD